MTIKNEVKHSDWHPADIKAEVHKRGFSFRSLSVEAGYAPDTLKNVLRAPCKSYEQIIAEAIGVPAETIWPSRYEARNNSYMSKVS